MVCSECMLFYMKNAYIFFWKNTFSHVHGAHSFFCMEFNLDRKSNMAFISNLHLPWLFRVYNKYCWTTAHQRFICEALDLMSWQRWLYSHESHAVDFLKSSGSTYLSWSCLVLVCSGFSSHLLRLLCKSGPTDSETLCIVTPIGEIILVIWEIFTWVKLKWNH